MDARIFQNSYVILVITFVTLCILFYFFEIGYTQELDQNKKIVETFSWKYPLAISLVVWLIWHFYIFPPPEDSNEPVTIVTPPSKNKLDNLKINMNNWN